MAVTDQVALDLFAGTGWGVACQRLGVKEEGVEIMREAIATREHNGMKTAYYDAWESDKAREIRHTTEIASPPCQTFSAAGRGTGRQALDQVVSLIHGQAYLDIPYLKMMAAAFGDDRTGLVLVPMHYAARYLPTYIAWEQVPTVLPVWEECAVELRALGYSVWTGYIHSEQYGVPQTRKRAYLIARRDGKEAQPPTPTHSKYYARNPTQLDIGVEKWVSMAEALGKHYSERTSESLPEWTTRRPATTVVGSFRPDVIAAPGYRKAGGPSRQNAPDSVTVTIDEAAALQSYPVGWGFTVRPAPTVTWHGLATRHPTGQQRIFLNAIEEGNFIFRPPYDEDSARKASSGSLSTQIIGDAVNMTPEEALVLQSYPRGFEFKGSRGKQFLQVGNAVPPLVAQAVLEELWT